MLSLDDIGEDDQTSNMNEVRDDVFDNGSDNNDLINE